MAEKFLPVHPGTYVRKNLLEPRGITVTGAAKLIGLSRQSVSNFLNGKTSATSNMAVRLEQTFGISTTKILEMQKKYDAKKEKKKTDNSVQNASPYVVSVLKFKANDIQNFFACVTGRSQLAVFLRMLVHSTGRNLQKVDFPGNDDAERPGWDGVVEANTGTPWVPFGISGWEFGGDERIKRKADSDFEKRVRQNEGKRSNITFVFVTPRRWPGKNAWIEEKKTKKLWKDVRAYDASDLEQWMEQSVAAQFWFADQTGRSYDGVKTLEDCWHDWADVTKPNLEPALFETAIETWKGKIQSFLEKDDKNFLTITADSPEEALAFLSQVLETSDLGKFGDRALVFDKTGVLPKLARGTTNFIAVIHTPEVAEELGPYCTSLKSIVFYPRNASNVQCDVELNPLGQEAFANALKEMEISRDDIAKLANASGRSLTVLRRCLAHQDAISKPIWAKNAEIAQGFVPLVLVGCWNSLSKVDQTILSLLAGTSWEELENRILVLLKFEDSPLWTIGGRQGVISKNDSLFLIADSVSKTSLDRFFDVAKIVLGEDDPAFELPEEERLVAPLRGKSQEFSQAMRESVAETLVMLAVYGNGLFKKRLGIDVEWMVANTVRELLTPLTTRRLEENEHELPLYAEAAPGTFLCIMERDLREEKPQVLGLLRPAQTWPLYSCPRTGLLWALEGLAWSPQNFRRVVKILGQLSEVEIDDNWGNKPIESLAAILRAWMPQTAATHEMRVAMVNMLLKNYPRVGWKICLRQLRDYRRCTGEYNYKPKWRPDGRGFGEPFRTWAPIRAFVEEMETLALNRPSYTVEMLCDLVTKLHLFTPEHQMRVWELIENWHDKVPNNGEIAIIRETIYRTFLSRWARKRFNEEDHANLLEKAKAVYFGLQPEDILNRYEWLFRQRWVEELPDELEKDEMDFQTREQRVEQLRREALTEILCEHGMSGIFALSDKGKCQREIGGILVSGILTEEQIGDLILQCLRSSENNFGRKDLLGGALWALGDKRRTLYESLRGKVSEMEKLRLLFLSPYRASTWELVEQLSAEARSRYWDEVVPQYIYDSHEENNESVRRLLKVGRPRAAFVSMDIKLEELDPSLLVQILSGMVKKSRDKTGEYRLDGDHVRRAFELINCNPELTLENKAGLEFAYLEVLTPLLRMEKQRRIPNLERHIELNPELFVQAVVWAYMRDDDGEDPPELRAPDNSREQCVERAHRLLETIGRIPGQDEATKEEQREKLEEWVRTVRRFCAELGRADIADFCLGKLFSAAPVGDDGVWPNEAVRDVMEDLQSEYINRGVYIGLRNARGPHWRKEGGDQERELANKYRAWADALQLTHPFVSSTLLMSMVKSYECDAEERDTEANVRRRLRY